MHAARITCPASMLNRAIHAFCALVFMAASGFADAQGPTRTIDRTPSCVNCTIVAERILTLGAATDPAYLTSNSLVFRDTKGRFYVRAYDQYSFVVFDSTGKFLRVVGRPTVGAQFSNISAFAMGRADSILVFQESFVNVLTPDLLPARTFSLPTAFDGATALANGSLLIANRVSISPTPLMLVTPVGTKVRDFGGPVDQRQCSGCTQRVADVSRSGDRIWLGLPNLYALQLWDTAGTMIETLTQRVEWFTPWNSEPARELSLEDVMMQPRLMRMHEDTVGRLWTQVIVPDPAYSPAGAPQPTGPMPDPRSDSRAFMAAMTKHFAIFSAAATINRVEIIDTRAARLYVSAEIPDGLALMPNGLASSFREDANGIIHHDIWRLVVRTR